MIAQQQISGGALSPNLRVPADYFTLSDLESNGVIPLICASDIFLTHPILAFCRQNINIRYKMSTLLTVLYL